MIALIIILIIIDIALLVGFIIVIKGINTIISDFKNEQKLTKFYISNEIKKLSKEIVIKNVLSIP